MAMFFSKGMPGLAKTLLVKSLGTALGVQFERIQFTPDLLPSDVVGTMIFQPKTGEFTAHRGPIFANLLLADEINRAPAKVQSALLEAMQERQVTIGGQTHLLPKPFFVMATQNPVEQEGTYPLPEAQTDRFLFKLLVDYPSAEEESSMMQRWGQVTKQPALVPASSGEELLGLRVAVDAIHVAPAVQGYILVAGSRTRIWPMPLSPTAQNAGSSSALRLALPSPCIKPAGRSLGCADKIMSSPSLIQELAPDVMRHRIGLTYEAEAEEVTADKSDQTSRRADAGAGRWPSESIACCHRFRTLERVTETVQLDQKSEPRHAC